MKALAESTAGKDDVTKVRAEMKKLYVSGLSIDNSNACTRRRAIYGCDIDVGFHSTTFRMDCTSSSSTFGPTSGECVRFFLLRLSLLAPFIFKEWLTEFHRARSTLNFEEGGDEIPCLMSIEPLDVYILGRCTYGRECSSKVELNAYQ